MEVETVPCLLCGASKTRLLYQGDGFAMGKCETCGLVRQNPRYTLQTMVEEYYDGAVQRGGFSWADKPRAGLEDWQPKPLLAYELSVADVDRARIRSGDKGVWVDVGASTGSLLVAARNAGWAVLGVEPGSGQVEICRRVHGMEMVHGLLPDAKLADGHAEVVSYRQVLEHIHDPITELREAHRVLASDGLLLIEVPHYGGQRYRLGRLRTALKVSKPYWRSLNVPEHLYYFTPETLTTLLERAGFETVFLRTYGKARRSRGVVRRVYEATRDRLQFGNKLRVIARPRPN